MILPIIAYGHPVLRQKAEPITADYPELEQLLENMFETMYAASGVGLAAPQVGLPIRIFVIDAEPMADYEGHEDEGLEGFTRVFINPEKIEESGTPWAFEEGCLSIPNIRESVNRRESITLKYMDVDFREHTETFTGLKARIVQHEYDHLEGVLFTDYLSSLKKKLLKSRLNKISKGKVKAGYDMEFTAK